MTDSEQTIEKHLTHIHSLLKAGQFIEAMETYFHDDVIIQEGNETPKEGKQLTLDVENDLIDNKLEEFIGYEVGNYAVRGNFSFYDAVMTLKMKDGSTFVSEQVVKTEWKDGKIFRERYYHM
jgi:hypothetical protein